MCAKAGLPRVVLSTGWAILEGYLLELMHKVNPAYRFQTCYKCGSVSKGTHVSRSEFKCLVFGKCRCECCVEHNWSPSMVPEFMQDLWVMFQI